MSTNNHFARSSGILLHISSLHSPYGIGTLGRAAYEWVDFLCACGQKYWQLLPHGPTGYGDSPYQTFSVFAGNSYFVDLDILCSEGLLERSDYVDVRWSCSDGLVNYGALYEFREPVLRKAYSRFDDKDALKEFMDLHPWAKPYGLYMAIKATQNQRCWTQWDNSLRLHEPDVIKQMQVELSEDILYHVFVQYKFYSQWDALRCYANEKGVRIIGDISIYAACDSADVWLNTELFQLDENNYPTMVAGCPPDGFTADGQLWGNPLYDWDALAKTDYEWWITRLKSGFELYDVLRIDHFRGFESYYAIPYGDTNAVNGHWKQGPGMNLINSIKRAFPNKLVIAEDLGYLTENVRKLLKDSGYPGMKILQFAFDTREGEVNEYLPYNYERNSVVYPGTHDNDTMLGWCHSAPEDSVAKAMEYVGVYQKSDLPRAIIRLAMQSTSDLAIIQMQDWLNLGSEARMNTPSVVDGNNWRWRIRGSDLTTELAMSIAGITSLYGRSTHSGCDLTAQ